MGFLENTLGDSPIVAAVKDEPGLEWYLCCLEI